MPLNFARIKLAGVLRYRCFYLFLALLLLIAATPVLAESHSGRIVANLINLLILLSATVAVSRSTVSCITSLSLALGVAIFQVLAFTGDETRYLFISWMFAAIFYAVTICYLLRYVLKPTALDLDKVYGAAAIYLMIGVLWAYFYVITQHFFPASFSVAGNVQKHASVIDLIYFSFTVLTTTGFGDIVPASPPARSLTILQQGVGVLYVAILIARLAGIYPPEKSEQRTS